LMTRFDGIRWHGAMPGLTARQAHSLPARCGQDGPRKRREVPAGFGCELGIPPTENSAAQRWAADAVVNLAGASIAGCRWDSRAQSDCCLPARVDTTAAASSQALSKDGGAAAARSCPRPAWHYGSCGDQVLTEEESARPWIFLSRGNRNGRAERPRAEAIGITRSLRARIWSHFGKTRRRLLPAHGSPVFVGAGGKIGSGEQWMSWVTLQDVRPASLRFALETARRRGADKFVFSRQTGAATPSSPRCWPRLCTARRILPCPAFGAAGYCSAKMAKMELAPLKARPRHAHPTPKSWAHRFLHRIGRRTRPAGFSGGIVPVDWSAGEWGARSPRPYQRKL